MLLSSTYKLSARLVDLVRISAVEMPSDAEDIIKDGVVPTLWHQQYQSLAVSCCGPVGSSCFTCGLPWNSSASGLR
jgi:hypothetical protein